MGREDYSQSSLLSTLVGQPVSRYTKLPKNKDTLGELTKDKNTHINRFHYSIYPEVENEYQATFTQLTNLDFFSPIITLVGDNPHLHILNTPFVDPGVILDAGSTLVSNVSNVNTNAYGTFKVTYVATDGVNPDTTKTRNVVVGELPVVSINGDNPYTLERYDTYSDEGITIDSNSVLRFTTSTVNNTTPGNYLVNYSVANGPFRSFHTRTVSVVDTLAPVVTILGDNPYTLERFDIYTDPGATGDIGTTVTSDLSNVQNTAIGSFVVVYNATDGNTLHDVAVTRTVNVVDTVPPVITVLGDDPFTLERFDVYTDAGATVDLGSTLTTDLSNVNNATSHGGSFTIVYTATDGNTAHDVVATRTVNVQDTTPPQISLIGDDPFLMQPLIYFPDVDPGVTLDAGTILLSTVSNINNAQSGYYQVDYTASDGVNDDVTIRRIVAVDDTLSPIITILGDNPYTIERYSEYIDEGVTLDPGSTLVSNISTVNNLVVGSYTVTYVATDGINPDTTEVRTVYVVDTTAPVITLNGASSVNLERYDVFADTDPGVTIEDGFLSSIDISLLDNTTQGTYTVTYTAEDGEGNSNVISRSVQVIDTVAPVVTVNNASTEYTLERYTAWADIDPGVTIDAGSYLYAVNLDNTTVGSQTVEYVVRDGTNETKAYRTITVEDTVDPVITFNGASSIIMERYAVFDDIDPGVTLDIGSYLTSVDTTLLNNTTVGSYIITYNASDGVNTNSANRIVSVVDSTPPVITLNGANPYYVERFSTFSDPYAYADAGSTMLPADLSNVNMDLDHNGTFDVVYSAIDGNNTSYAVRTVVVIDTVPPQIIINGGSAITIERFSTYSDSGVTIDEGTTLISTDLSNVDTTISNGSTFDVVYTAYDTNTYSSNIRTVTVVDTVPPIYSLVGSDPYIMYINDNWADIDPGVSLDQGSYIESINTEPINNTNFGEYTVTYNLSDNVFSNTVTRVVNVAHRTLTENYDFSGLQIGDDDFGHSVSINSNCDVIACGAPRYGGNNQRDGAIKIFKKNSSNAWELNNTFNLVEHTNISLVAGDNFGESVSVSNDGTKIVVAAATGIRNTYLIEYVNNVWTGSYFTEDLNKAVAISSNVIVAANSTDMRIYRYGTSWVEEFNDDGDGKLTQHGVCISEDQTTVAVGLPDSDNVDVYVHQGGNWSKQVRLSEPESGSNDWYGAAVSLSGDGNILVVGAPLDASTSYEGRAHVYTRSGSTWTLDSTLYGSDVSVGDEFGHSVSISRAGDVICVGANRQDFGSFNNAGACYIFIKTSSGWVEKQKLANFSDKRFGEAVSVWSDGVNRYTLAVGAENTSKLRIFET